MIETNLSKPNCEFPTTISIEILCQHLESLDENAKSNFIKFHLKRDGETFILLIKHLFTRPKTLYETQINDIFRVFIKENLLDEAVSLLFFTPGNALFKLELYSLLKISYNLMVLERLTRQRELFQVLVKEWEDLTFKPELKQTFRRIFTQINLHLYITAKL